MVRSIFQLGRATLGRSRLRLGLALGGGPTGPATPDTDVMNGGEPVTHLGDVVTNGEG